MQQTSYCAEEKLVTMDTRMIILAVIVMVITVQGGNLEDACDFSTDVWVCRPSKEIGDLCSQATTVCTTEQKPLGCTSTQQESSWTCCKWIQSVEDGLPECKVDPYDIKTYVFTGNGATPHRRDDQESTATSGYSSDDSSGNFVTETSTGGTGDVTTSSSSTNDEPEIMFGLIFGIPALLCAIFVFGYCIYRNKRQQPMQFIVQSTTPLNKEVPQYCSYQVAPYHYQQVYTQPTAPYQPV